MPIDNTIALGVQNPQTQALNPLSIYQMMQDRQTNALRNQALEQEMTKNALAMQYMAEEKNRAAANAAAAAADKARLRGIYSDYSYSPAAIGQRGAGYSGTGVSTNPYERLVPKLVQEGYVPQAGDVAELMNKQATGEKTKAETKGLLTENQKKEYDLHKQKVGDFKDSVIASNSVPEVLDLIDSHAPSLMAMGITPDQAKKNFMDKVNTLGFEKAVLLSAKGALDTQKHLSDMATARAGRSEIKQTDTGQMVLVDKDTSKVTPLTMGAPTAGVPTAGVPTAGVPTAGVPTAGVPTAGAPTAGAPTAGAPVMGAPTEAQVKAAAARDAIPSAIQTAELTLKQIEDMIGSENLFGKDKVGALRKPSEIVPEHPGFQSAVGGTIYPFAGYFSGTDTTNFNERLKQVQGKAFLDAYETLKGTGQITEKEGEKATAAKSRMSTAQSEKEFILAAKEFTSIIQNAITRAKTKLGANAPAAAATPAPTSGGPTVSNWGE